MHKRKRFKNTRASECSGTVPLKIRISGDIVPSANGIIPADFASEDLCVNSFKEGSLIIDLDVSSSAIMNVGYFINVVDMLLSALLQRDQAIVMDSSKYVIVSMEFPSYSYTKEHLQTSDIYKTEQSVKRQQKEAESEPNDLKKISRGLRLRSKRQEKKSSDTSLTDDDLMRTSSSNQSLVHFETSRTRPSSMNVAHFTSGNASFSSNLADKYVNVYGKLRERQKKEIDEERIRHVKIDAEIEEHFKQMVSDKGIQELARKRFRRTSSTKTKTEERMQDLNTARHDTRTKSSLWNLTKPSSTVTSTGKHMKGDNDFGSDTKMKQRMLSLTKTSGTETSTGKHMKDDKYFSSDTKNIEEIEGLIRQMEIKQDRRQMVSDKGIQELARKRPMFNLINTSKTRTEEHMTDLHTVGSDTKIDAEIEERIKQMETTSPKPKTQASWITAKNPEERRKDPCRHFIKRGMCDYGDNCLFLHSISAHQTPEGYPRY